MKDHFCKYAALLVVIGLVNNLGYVIVGTTAKKLAKLFNKESLLGLFQLYSAPSPLASS